MLGQYFTFAAADMIHGWDYDMGLLFQERGKEKNRCKSIFERNLNLNLLPRLKRAEI